MDKSTPEGRLLFLQSRIRQTLNRKALPGTATLSDRERRLRRQSLSRQINSQSVCYVCHGKAVLRHHVIPVSHGGRNKRSNLVVLCHPCHQQIHAPFRTQPEAEITLPPTEYQQVVEWFDRHVDKPRFASASELFARLKDTDQ